MTCERFVAFISYASRYTDWVEVLQRNLERCLAPGSRIFLDRTDLGAGQSWVAQLQAGIDRAERLLLVATPEAMVSPRVADEWQAFISTRRDWHDGRLLVLRLIDTPLPPFPQTVQHVDFTEHDEAKYRQALAEVMAALRGDRDRRSLPELPTDLEVPAPPDPGLPAAVRRGLVAWLAPVLGTKMGRLAVAAGLNLPKNALEHYPSSECAAAAALVLATGDDEPATAARRFVDVLLEVAAEGQPERAGELRALGEAVDRLRQGFPVSGLLAAWRQRVERDHGTLVSYFQQRAGFDLLDPVYVQLELRPDLQRCLPDEQALPHLDRALEIGEVLALSPDRHPWVTRRWVVLGDPGAGKTTLLRHLAAAMAREPVPGLVPVFESLPRLLREREWLLDRLERQMGRAGHQVRGLAGVLDRAGQQGALLLLLDGLDEVPAEDRVDAELLLRELTARWPATPIVVTSRPIGYRRPAGEFVELQLLPLDATRRRSFLARWFGRFDGRPDEQRAGQELHQLEQDPGLRELAANPLYLTLMALLIEQDSPPRRHRAGLYDQVFHLLLNGRHRPQGQPIDCLEAVRGVLRHLAHAMTRDNRDAEAVEKLEARLYQPALDRQRDQLERVPRWRRSLRAFLDELGERTGILGPHDGEDADWRFWHRTFREALTAEALQQALAAGGEEAVLAQARQITGNESRWAEPYALLAGRIERPDELVRSLVRENRSLGLRALATAQGLNDETLDELLELTADWQERARVYPRVPELLGDAERTIALLDRLRRRTTNGNDLFFIDQALLETGRHWPEWEPRTSQLRHQLYDHIPSPSEELFDWTDTPRDGRVPLWREIPAGSFRMGSPPRQGPDRERPRHRVTIAAPFRCGAVPVTNRQYAAFDSSFKPYQWSGVTEQELAGHPAVRVTWYEAVSFCRWLSATLPHLAGARLPVEEEWEYACRAGTETRYWSGDTEENLAAAGWYYTNAGDRTHRVGEKQANSWGLYDTHGNVWEWTLSEFTEQYFGRENGVVLDPSAVQTADLAAPNGTRRVMRGGGYWSTADWARAAYRVSRHPAIEYLIRGFRVVIPIGPERQVMGH